MTNLDSLYRAIQADAQWCGSGKLTPRARIKALKRIERNARRLRRLIALSYADTMAAPNDDTTDPGLGEWVSSKLETTRFHRPLTEG